MNLTLTIPGTETSPITVTVGGTTLSQISATGTAGSPVVFKAGGGLEEGTFPQSASDVSDLTTTGLTAGNLLRVAAGGGLEEITPVLTRTAAEGDPNIPDAIVLSGALVDTQNNVLFTTPVTLVLLEYQHDRPRYGNALSNPRIRVSPQYNGVERWWAIVFDGVEGGNALFELVSDAVSPVGLTGWTPDAYSSGVPTITGSPSAIPAFLGQKCIVGDDGAGALTGNGKRLEYTSLDGETWTLTGPSGVQEDASTPGNLIVTTFGAGATPTYESQTISNYLTA